MKNMMPPSSKPLFRSAFWPSTRHLRGEDSLRRIAIIGNFLPRQCGIATFTSHVHHALRRHFPQTALDVYAMAETGADYGFPPPVVATISQERLGDYAQAARSISRSRPDFVWLQHEFGIYGGPAGRYVLALLDGISAPCVATLHTVLDRPSDDQRAVIASLGARCAKLIVMAEKGREILGRVYGVDSSKIAVVPHGVPDRPYVDPDSMKPKFGLATRKVIMTFGLLSPGKGAEAVIDALPNIVSRCPEAIYVIVGATHPHLLAREGEAYRDRLKSLAERLGVARHVRWIDRFLSETELLDHLAAADIYVTPYRNPAQITSGALSYAIGLGKPVISTPYAHAAELLRGGIGKLVGFGSSEQLGHAIGDLLTDDAERRRTASEAYKLGRNMTWQKMVASVAALTPAPSRAVELRRSDWLRAGSKSAEPASASG